MRLQPLSPTVVFAVAVVLAALFVLRGWHG